jgi:hypothetical protein
MITSRWQVHFIGDGPSKPTISPALRIDGGLRVDLERR